MKSKKDSGQSTEKIKVAAMHLFAIKGYPYTSLEEIAHKAGFTKGAVYYYFKSKKRLILEILDDIEKRSIDLTAKEVSLVDGSSRDALVRFFKSQADWAANHPDDLGVLIMMSVSFPRRESEIHSKIEVMYEKITQVLTGIITQGVKNGELPSDTNIKDAVIALITSHDGNMLHWYRSGRDPQVGRQLIKSLIGAWLHPLVFT